MRDVHRERRLADPALPRDHRQADRARLAGRTRQQAGEQRDFCVPADEVGQVGRKLPGLAGGGETGAVGHLGRVPGRLLAVGKRRIGDQDLLVQVLQRPARVDPEILAQDAARLLVGRQRLGGPSAPVQGEHQLGPDSLPVRVGGDEPAQVGGDHVVLAGAQVRLDASLLRLRPQLQQPGRLAPLQQRRRDVGQRLAAP